MNKNYKKKHLFIAFLCGSIFFSAFSFAAGQQIEVIRDSLKFFVNGGDKTSSDGMFDNNGSMVPASFIYSGTTYIPLRMVSNLLKTPVYWEENTKSISLGKPHVQIFDSVGKEIGEAVLTQVEKGVNLAIKASVLTPGKHGIHIHQNAIQGLDLKSAGGHFDPEHKQHGLNNPEGHHMGDLPNLEVKPDGTVETVFLIENATLEKGKSNSLLGKSIIIHAKEDDEMTDPSGNSGDRIAGGTIGQ